MKHLQSQSNWWSFGGNTTGKYTVEFRLICRIQYRRIQRASGKQNEKVVIFFVKTLFTSNVFAEAYSEPCQTSKIEIFSEIVNRSKPLIVFAKHSILDVRQDQEYASI